MTATEELAKCRIHCQMPQQRQRPGKLRPVSLRSSWKAMGPTCPAVFSGTHILIPQLPKIQFLLGLEKEVPLGKEIPVSEAQMYTIKMTSWLPWVSCDSFIFQKLHVET